MHTVGVRTVIDLACLFCIYDYLNWAFLNLLPGEDSERGKVLIGECLDRIVPT